MYDHLIDIFRINYDKNILSSIGIGDKHMDIITNLENFFIHIFCTQLIRTIQDGYTVTGSLAKEMITKIADQTFNIFINTITS